MSDKLNPTLIFKVRENEYKIDQPNIGKIIDIEMMKASITNGNYGKMVANLNELSILSLDMVDMFTHFRVLCPQLLNDLSVNNWTDLGAFDAIDILKAYNEQFKPWYDQFSGKLLSAWQATTDSLKKTVGDQKDSI